MIYGRTTRGWSICPIGTQRNNCIYVEHHSMRFILYDALIKKERILHNTHTRAKNMISSTIIEAIGYAGGLLIAISLLPQVIHTLRTKSTRDISYGYQTSYIAGCILSYAYFVLVQATAAWVCLTFELSCAILLFGMKLHLDGCDQKIKGDGDEPTPDHIEVVDDSPV
jgi:uncharacterized protein with PQ loop repeat